MKKILTAFCALALAFLCACGSPSGGQSGSLSICVDGNGLNEMFLGPILAEFESQNPHITLEVEYLPAYKSDDSAMIEQRASALARARTELMGGQGADIYLFFGHVGSGRNTDSYMLFPDLERHILAGVLHDLDFLYNDPRFDAEEYIPALQGLGEYEGKSYALALSYTASTLVGMAEPLRDSGFEPGTADRSSLVDQLLAMEEARRPYLAAGSTVLLANSTAMQPVSVQKAEIQLNSPAWQQTLTLAKKITDQCSQEADFSEILDYEASAKAGAAILIGASTTMPPYGLRVLEDQCGTARLIPIPNENGGVTVQPYVTAVVSAGSRNTGAAADLLLFLLGDTVQGCQTLDHIGGTANLSFNGMSWPVRRGCGVKMLEQLSMSLVRPGAISDTLKADVEQLESRADCLRLTGRYDAELYALVEPYLNGSQTWEECYENIQAVWSYLDE